MKKVLFTVWGVFLFLKIFKRNFCFGKMQNKGAEKGLEKSSDACGCGGVKEGENVCLRLSHPDAAASCDKADARFPRLLKPYLPAFIGNSTMKKRAASQSGQATTEMVFMLLGFAILLLGLIFTMSLEIFNTRTLMESKYETERASSFTDPALNPETGKEIKGWDYDNGIPFTLKDSPNYHAGGEISLAQDSLGTAVDSNGRNYAYEWTKLKEFPNGKFIADYKDRDQSAIAAANLLSRQGDPEGRMLTAKLPELVTGLAKLLGVRVNYDKLRNNPSNRVFMPANGEL